MQIFPAIDLSGGQVVRLYQGDYDKMTVYGADPCAVARDFIAAGAKYLHIIADHVVGLAAVDGADVQQAGIVDLQLLGCHEFHGGNGLHGHQNGILALLLGSCMGRKTVEADLKAHGIGAQIFIGKGHGANHPVGGAMGGQAAVHIVQHAVFGQLLAAGGDVFLGGGEEELDAALEVTDMLHKILEGGQQNGGVGIVAAGVHHAVMGGLVGALHLLLNGKGIHIGPQTDGKGGILGAQVADYRAAAPFIGVA